MRARYKFGLALAQRQEYTASSETIRAYLDSTPDSKDTTTIRKQLEQIEEAAKGKSE